MKQQMILIGRAMMPPAHTRHAESTASALADTPRQQSRDADGAFISGYEYDTPEAIDIVLLHGFHAPPA